MIDENFLIHTLRDLVQINSVNPDLSSDGPGEEEIGLYIDGVLRSLNIRSEVVQLAPKRVNVIGILKGTGNGKSLMLNAHTDTVGIEGMEAPFSAAIKDGKLYGRGAYDMKASIAAMLAATKALRDNSIALDGDLMVTFVADEEYESIGIQDLVKNYKTDAAIVMEPTDLDVCIGHRGFGIFEITTNGKVAHGGRHQEGIDANMKMGAVLTELEKHSRKLPDEKSHPLFGQASMHVPVIRGGESLFIYSGKCSIQVERRTLPGETQQEILKDFQTIIDERAAEDKDFSAQVKPLIWRDPYEISRDTPIVQTVMQCASDVIGNKPSYIGHTWWEDSAIIGKNGTDTVIFGPLGGGIHQKIEWVDIKSVVDLSKILVQTAILYCKR